MDSPRAFRFSGMAATAVRFAWLLALASLGASAELTPDEKDELLELRREVAAEVVAEAPHGPADNFHLWTRCAPIIVSLGGVDEDLRESVKGAAESRLRAARLWPRSNSTVATILAIDVSRGEGWTFRISIGIKKLLFDPISGTTGFAYSHNSGGNNYGAYGTAPDETIRNVVADLLDRFIADYLRVNESAC